MYKILKLQQHCKYESTQNGNHNSAMYVKATCYQSACFYVTFTSKVHKTKDIQHLTGTSNMCGNSYDKKWHIKNILLLTHLNDLFPWHKIKLLTPDGKCCLKKFSNPGLWKAKQNKELCKIIKWQNKIQFVGISYQNTANPHIFITVVCCY